MEQAHSVGTASHRCQRLNGEQMKNLFALGVTLAFFGLCVLSIWYVGSRLHTLFELKSRWPILIAVATGVIGALFAMGAVAKFTSPVVGALNVFGGYVFTFHLFLLLSLLFLQVLQLMWSLPMSLSGAAALLVAFIATAASALNANGFSVNEYKVELPKLQKEVTVMQISDVHLGHHRGQAYLEKIVAETNRRKPDLVLLTGDLVDSNAALVPGVLNPLADLKAPAYFVGGNHEKYVDMKRAFELIAQQGVRVLNNEVVETKGIQLIGLDYMNADEDAFDMHPSDDTRTIKSVMPDLPLKRGLPTVLMHHSPVGTQHIVETDVDLMVSGHTHAGQVLPATWIAELIFPFNRGLHQHGKLKVFVSQGAGTYLLRNRLGTNSEINLLRLTPSY